METKSNFLWVDIYQEMADKLLEFRYNRTELIGLIESVYHAVGIRLPKLDSCSPANDIDPFTVMGLFNKHISQSNRVAILGAFKEALNLQAPLPNVFDGIPILNNLNATFYRFSDDSDRGEYDIDNLWALFAEALKYAENGQPECSENFACAYDTVRLLKGNRWKLTMGLFWIRPNVFLNLDSRNRWYIEEKCDIPLSLISEIASLKEPPPAKDYLRICKDLLRELNSGKHGAEGFPEFSHTAWSVSEQVNDEIKYAKQAAEISTDPILADVGIRPTRYWLYLPGKKACLWEGLQSRGIIVIGWGALGDLREYGTPDEIGEAMDEEYGSDSSHVNNKKAAWQFVHEMREGDIVFVKRGFSEIIGRGVVVGDYSYSADFEEGYDNARYVEWTHVGSWVYPGGRALVKTLTDISSNSNLVASLNAFFETEGIEESFEQADPVYTAYTKDDFLNQVFMEEDVYNTLVYLVNRKKNVILEGAPGVGKTFCAKRLAYSMMGMKDASRVCMVQFHQSYTYEDFIEGFRPAVEGFELKKGVFYNFCKLAEENSDQEYFFIIDEINRGNLSKILGELFMLIEADKRGVELSLLYSGEQFSVPRNMYIIGTMNTADRSIALLDYALRRRFAFFQLKPGFNTRSFAENNSSITNPAFNKLVDCVCRLNETIADDELLGDGFAIGHSYLCGFDSGTAQAENLKRVIDFEIEPLLKEYWYDDPENVRKWVGKLQDSIK